MHKKLILVAMLSVLALACGPLGALSKPKEIQETAAAMVGTVQAMVTEAPEMIETVQAVVTEAPELMETVEAAMTESPIELPTIEPVTGGGGEEIRQWAAMASASSAYGDPSWAAIQASGAPDTFECGDVGTAWASATSNSVEWLEVGFARSVVPTEISIYQTYNPDQVVKVELIDINSGYTEIYSADPRDMSSEPCPYVLTIPVDTELEVGGLRITVDQSVVGGWNEIDAVELVGETVGG